MAKIKVYLIILLILFRPETAFTQSKNNFDQWEKDNTQRTEYAQSGTFGVRLGAIYSKVKFTDGPDLDHTGDYEYGGQIGVFYKVNVNNLYMKFGLDHTFITNDVVLIDFEGSPNFPATGEDETLRMKFGSFDIPLLLGLNFGDFSFELGPVGSFVVKAQGEFMNSKYDMTNDFRTLSIGIRTGIGYTVGKISFEFNYEQVLSKIGETLYWLDHDHNIKNLRFNAGLRYSFKTKELGGS